jgi:hypothetical protein
MYYRRTVLRKQKCIKLAHCRRSILPIQLPKDAESFTKIKQRKAKHGSGKYPPQKIPKPLSPTPFPTKHHRQRWYSTRVHVLNRHHRVGVFQSNYSTTLVKAGLCIRAKQNPHHIQYILQFPASMDPSSPFHPKQQPLPKVFRKGDGALELINETPRVPY